MSFAAATAYASFLDARPAPTGAWMAYWDEVSAALKEEWEQQVAALAALLEMKDEEK
jgi:hypothetical protein